MTESRLSIVIDSRSAEQQARDLEKAMLALEQAGVRVTGTSAKAGAAFDKAGDHATASAAKTRALKTSLSDARSAAVSLRGALTGAFLGVSFAAMLTKVVRASNDAQRAQEHPACAWGVRTRRIVGRVQPRASRVRVGCEVSWEIPKIDARCSPRARRDMGNKAVSKHVDEDGLAFCEVIDAMGRKQLSNWIAGRLVQSPPVDGPYSPARRTTDPPMWRVFLRPPLVEVKIQRERREETVSVRGSAECWEPNSRPSGQLRKFREIPGNSHSRRRSNHQWRMNPAQGPIQNWTHLHAARGKGW